MNVQSLHKVFLCNVYDKYTALDSKNREWIKCFSYEDFHLETEYIDWRIVHYFAYARELIFVQVYIGTYTRASFYSECFLYERSQYGFFSCRNRNLHEIVKLSFQ